MEKPSTRRHDYKTVFMDKRWHPSGIDKRRADHDQPNHHNPRKGCNDG